MLKIVKNDKNTTVILKEKQIADLIVLLNKKDVMLSGFTDTFNGRRRFTNKLP